ncbi:MAG TPA: hypothetical protein VG895_02120 [Patescibacteria group bacterium]|nr:hypothetical protein [Patescibacteria group bacterium]
MNLEENNIPTKSDPMTENDNTLSNLVGKTSNYSEWKDVIKINFPELVLPAEVCLSMFGQLLIEDIVNPCAIVLVDVPSAGKTIILNMFTGTDYTYATDNFTPSSFVSQAANVKKEKLAEVDLLPRIKDKVLIIRDMAPLFGQRDDDLLRNMGVLTRVMDGEGLQIDAGVHGSRGYSGSYNFMLLAASTPISPRIFKLMGNLGSRLFFLNVLSTTKTEVELAEQLIKSSWKEKQKMCTSASQSYIETLFKTFPNGITWNKQNDSMEIIKIISRAASILAKLRGSINVWKDSSLDGTDYSYQEPVIEKPDRINQILYNLARGHALVCDRTQISSEDVKIVLNVAFDSAPSSRTKIFRFLILNNGAATTTEIVTRLNCSSTTADKEMEKLKILGIVDMTTDCDDFPGRPSKMIRFKKEFEWFYSNECLNLIEIKNTNDKQVAIEKQETLASPEEKIFNEFL